MLKHFLILLWEGMWINHIGLGGFWCDPGTGWLMEAAFETSTGSEGLWSHCRTCSSLLYSTCSSTLHALGHGLEGGLPLPATCTGVQAKPRPGLTISGSRENMNCSSFHAQVWCWALAQISIRSNRDFHCAPSMALNGPSSPQVRFIHRRRRSDTGLQPWIWPHSSGSNVFQTSERAFVRMCVFGKG